MERRTVAKRLFTILYPQQRTRTKSIQSSHHFIQTQTTHKQEENNAIKFTQEKHETPTFIGPSLLLDVLQKYDQSMDLQGTRTIHSLMTVTGQVNHHMVLTNILIKSYIQCQSIDDACCVFDGMGTRNVFTWTLMVGGYAKAGNHVLCLELFSRMRRQDKISPNQFTISSILPSVAEYGHILVARMVHCEVIKGGFERNLITSSAMVDMYAKCKNVRDARQVFDKMPEKNSVTWMLMIAGSALNHDMLAAKNLFKEIENPDSKTWSAMITGYLANGSIDNGLELFDIMPVKLRDEIAWTALILGCSHTGYEKVAVEVFRKMVASGVTLSTECFRRLLISLASLGNLQYSIEVHPIVVRDGFLSDSVVANGLVDVYIKCERIDLAHKVVLNLSEPNVFIWNTLLAGYCQIGEIDEALEIYKRMPEKNVFSWNALILGYGHCGRVDCALDLFQGMPERDVFSWTTMMSMLVQNARVEEGLEMFYSMSERNLVAWNAAIQGYAQIGKVEQGLSMFFKMPERDTMSWNIMITGLMQNEEVDQAYKLFRMMDEKERNAISWTAMISGYVQNGSFDLALKSFLEMQSNGVRPKSDTFASVLPACANLASLNHGKELHGYTIRVGFQTDTYVGSALVDMYAKCGELDVANHVFSRVLAHDVVLWNALILGYAINGYGLKAIDLFMEMQESGIHPDHITFLGVLNGCCHAGMVTDGLHYFDVMRYFYGIAPTTEHCCSIVDLLGRAGRLHDAVDFVKKMPVKPNVSILLALLGACRTHQNNEIADTAANLLFELNPTIAAPYIILSNIYAAAGKWDDVLRIRKLMKDKGVVKNPGCSWIEINRKNYAFVVGDKSNPQTDKIYAELERLTGEMRNLGYQPTKELALSDVEEEQKESLLSHHTEKLAIAFGLINTSAETPLRVIKNLRVCVDCHVAIKLVSKITTRKIVLRDATRFHHFENGQCSCGDYW